MVALHECAGPPLERRPNIRHDQHGYPETGSRWVFAQDAGTAMLHGISDKRMAIAAFAFDGKKELPRRGESGVVAEIVEVLGEDRLVERCSRGLDQVLQLNHIPHCSKKLSVIKSQAAHDVVCGLG